MAGTHNSAMEITQVAAVLNEIQAQATGKSTIATATNPAEFVSVAQTALLTIGKDPMMNAISQVLNRTVFSVRPYEAKFKGLEMTLPRFGNHTRKLQMVDKDAVEDEGYKLTDGASVDQWVVRKPEVVQTNFYSEAVYEDFWTIFENQLDVAFTSAEEFQQFLSMVASNANDKAEQWRENTARATLVNLIGAIIKGGKDTQKIHLVTEFGEITGETETWAAIQADRDKYEHFVKWMCAKIKTISAYMTNRSCVYHNAIGGKEIMRHTPYNRMKCYMMTSEINQIESNVFASIYNPEYLKLIDHETVDFWQDIATPYGINATVSYMDSTGAAATATVTQSNILGVLFDEDAAGYAMVDHRMSVSPYNGRGRYWNNFAFNALRSFVDLSENAVLFLLD